MKLLVASGNAKKLAELQSLAADLPVEVLGPAALPIELPDVEETGSTFAGNARLKAVAFAQVAGMPAIADDSGLCVDALGGEPGVRSARYSGEDPVPDRDERNNRKLLRALRDVPAALRGASFHCALCLALPDGTVHEVEGRWRGAIAFSPRGQNGFGYDPLFLLPSLGRTSAELAPEEKARLSHRAQAMQAMRGVLEGLVRP